MEIYDTSISGVPNGVRYGLIDYGYCHSHLRGEWCPNHSSGLLVLDRPIAPIKASGVATTSYKVTNGALEYQLVALLVDNELSIILSFDSDSVFIAIFVTEPVALPRVVSSLICYDTGLVISFEPIWDGCCSKYSVTAPPLQYVMGPYYSVTALTP